MKIGIISDIHGNIIGLNKVLKAMGKVDKILCSGDLTGYYSFVNEVINKVKERKIISIKGNHDKYTLLGKAPKGASIIVKESILLARKTLNKKNLKILNDLPDFLITNIAGKNVAIYHASPWNYFEERIYPDYPNFDRFKKIDADVVILGHTHYPMIKKIGKLILLNSGSCGQPRDNSKLSYITWDTKKNTFLNKRL